MKRIRIWCISKIQSLARVHFRLGLHSWKYFHLSLSLHIFIYLSLSLGSLRKQYFPKYDEGKWYYKESKNTASNILRIIIVRCKWVILAIHLIIHSFLFFIIFLLLFLLLAHVLLPGILISFLLTFLLVCIVLAVLLIIFLLLFHWFIPLVFLIEKIIKEILLISLIAIFNILIPIFVFIIIAILRISLILLLLSIPLIISIETWISCLLIRLTTNIWSHSIIIFSYFRITENTIGIRDFFEFFFSFPFIFIWVIFLSKLVIGLLYFLLIGVSRNSQDLVIVDFRVKLRKLLRKISFQNLKWLFYLVLEFRIMLLRKFNSFLAGNFRFKQLILEI